MSAQTAPSTAAVPAASVGGMIRAEFVKLFSLRSTYWLLGFALAAIIGLSALIAWAISSDSGDASGGPGPGGSGGPFGAAAPSALISAIGAAITFGQLPIAVLGVLAITGEFSSGTIKTTLTAAPDRITVLFAKVVAVFVTATATGVVGVLAAAAVAGASLGRDTPIDLGDGRLWGSLGATVLYLAAISLVSLGIGFLLRSPAGSIATALGLVLVVPNVLQIIGALTRASWPGDVSAFLPSVAGATFYSYPNSLSLPSLLAGIQLEPWQGGLVLAAWVIGLLIAAGAVIRRRDA